MYTVNRKSHTKYGNVIEILIEEDGQCETPFQAIHAAKKMKRLWLEEAKSKVRILINNQIVNLSQMESWAVEEYKSLAKCESCAKILNGKVFTHAICGANLFCSQSCADKDFLYQSKRFEDYDESECY